MKSDKLQDAIGEVKDEHIADAHPEAAAPQKKNRRIVWVAAAARPVPAVMVLAMVRRSVSKLCVCLANARIRIISTCVSITA